jgi:chromate transporter
MISTIISLCLLFGSLSLVSIGGGNTVIPDIHRAAVLNYHWLTDKQFAASFAIAQAAPGPGSLIVALVGWKAAGWPGAIAATSAMYAPACTLTFICSRLWLRFRNSPWLILIEKGLAPISIGLILASGWIILQDINRNWLTDIFTLITIWNVIKMRIHPILLMAIAAIAGIAGLMN